MPAELKVWTNGCFEFLHAGHIDFLRRMYALFGTKINVLLNTDESFKKWKGRWPYLTYRERSVVLAATKYVGTIHALTEVCPKETYMNLFRREELDFVVFGPRSENPLTNVPFHVITINSTGSMIDISSTQIIQRVLEGERK